MAVNWNFERKNIKRKYNVYVHYVTDIGSEYIELAGETWAVSPEQAEHNVSFRCGDDGERKIAYNGYTCNYEAIEVVI